jgi:hypothetical protein
MKHNIIGSIPGGATNRQTITLILRISGVLLEYWKHTGNTSENNKAI